MPDRRLVVSALGALLLVSTAGLVWRPALVAWRARQLDAVVTLDSFEELDRVEAIRRSLVRFGRGSDRARRALRRAWTERDWGGYESSFGVALHAVETDPEARLDIATRLLADRDVLGLGVDWGPLRPPIVRGAGDPIEVVVQHYEGLPLLPDTALRVRIACPERPGLLRGGEVVIEAEEAGPGVTPIPTWFAADAPEQGLFEVEVEVALVGPDGPTVISADRMPPFDLPLLRVGSGVSACGGWGTADGSR